VNVTAQTTKTRRVTELARFAEKQNARGAALQLQQQTHDPISFCGNDRSGIIRSH
jgi:hypothetical protein